MAIALPVALALAGGAASIYQASESNKAQKAQIKATYKAQGFQSRQIMAQSAVEKLRATNRANLIKGRIRVAAGESGIGLGGTYTALMHQADYDEMINRVIADRNAGAAIGRVRQEYPYQPTNPLLAGIMGAMSGAQSGLSIGTGIERMLE